MKKAIPVTLLLILFIALSFQGNCQSQYQAEIKGTAIAFVNTLDKMQQRVALLAFNDTARIKWNNLPVGLRARAGMSVGNMTTVQRKLFHRLLSAALSSQGYLKATSIMRLDELLNQYYDSLLSRKEINDTTHGFMRALLWSPKNFFLAFFGNPSEKIWGFKVEGHHLSINFSFINDRLSVTPLFVGTDPAEYPQSEWAGLRVLGQEEDLGIRLIHMLNPGQQKLATASSAVPGDIITAAESGKRLIDNWGLQGSAMNNEQRKMLEYIVREFVFNLEYEKAVAEFEKIRKAGIEKIYFGWIGSYDESKPHYYVLNGPGFLIEFDNSGFGGKANHIHAIWREKGNEFGEDVLKEHYLREHR
jgi:hypothetical protein